jgi:hypothetical protein
MRRAQIVRKLWPDLISKALKSGHRSRINERIVSAVDE